MRSQNSSPEPREPAAVKFEILVIRAGVVRRGQRCHRSRGSEVGGKLQRFGQRLKALLIDLVGIVPHQRQAERADLELGAVQQAAGAGQAVDFHLLLKIRQVQIDAFESERQRQFDDFTLTPRHTERIGAEIPEHPTASYFRNSKNGHVLREPPHGFDYARIGGFFEGARRRARW